MNVAGSARILPPTAFNPVFLDPAAGLRRGLILPERERDAVFVDNYEDRCLFYDAFRDRSRTKVILHGPKPIDLEPVYGEAQYFAEPGHVQLQLTPHHSRHVHLYSANVPREATHVDIDIAGQRHSVAIGETHTDRFVGRNVLTTLSKDNDLVWIKDWAEFHVRHHGADAVLFFDNGSTRYTTGQIEQTLAQVPGLAVIQVVPVPFRYPQLDHAVPEDIFWAHFLQPSVLVNMLRRYAQTARAILSIDVDELVVPLGRRTVFESAVQSRSGTVYFRSQWIEPQPVHEQQGARRHRDYGLVRRGQEYWRMGTAKWAMAPDRTWLGDLRRHPYPHAIENRPILTRHKPSDAYVAHFRAITTNWKQDRDPGIVSGGHLVPDDRLRRAFDQLEIDHG